jgi:hypothetical protein
VARTLFDYKTVFLNDQIQIKSGKYTAINVNRMKKCHKLPGKAKDIKKRASVTPERKFSDDDWNDSDNEPFHLLGRTKFPLSWARLKIRETASQKGHLSMTD